MQWNQGLSQAIKAVIAVDGRTLRDSHGPSAGKKVLRKVSLRATENRLVLAQLATEEK